MARKRIGLLTSGGDAPGMNAAIRAVVRSAINEDMKVTGFLRGYEGLINCKIMDMEPKTVSDIIHKGGTVLLTARCEEMRTEQGQERAAKVCEVLGIDTLIIIGGGGSLKGAETLMKLGVSVIVIPATIDRDMPYTEYTIGFDTAVNTALDAINKIRDTSTSHERCSVVEVMGAGCGLIGLWCGVTGGAEEVVIPERAQCYDSHEAYIQAVLRQIMENRSKGKRHNLVIVAEAMGGSEKLSKEIEKVTGIESRSSVLGYLQRGGSPSAADRMHASLMGSMAVSLAKQGETSKAIAYLNGTYAAVDISGAITAKYDYDDKLYDIIKVLAI